MSSAALIEHESVTTPQQTAEESATPAELRAEPSDQLFGLDAEAIMRIGNDLRAIGALPVAASVAVGRLPHAIKLLPLAEQIKANGTLTPEDVRPYLGPIKSAAKEVGAVYKPFRTLGLVALDVPFKHRVNARVEREVAARAPEAIDTARALVLKIESQVDFLANFENPKKQFETELSDIAQSVSSAILAKRDERVNDEAQIKSEPETPKGIAGVFVKAVRKIRDFFGMFKRNKPAVNQEVTAYDAGAGIEKVLSAFSQQKEASEKLFPMFSKLVFERLPSTLTLSRDHLAFVAPEILNFLFSTSSDEQGDDLIDSINRNPHEFRFVTKFKRHYGRFGRYSLDGIQRASNTLLPAIRDVLPTEGAKVRETFDQIEALLERKPGAEDRQPGTAQSSSPKSPRKSLRARFKQLFRRH